MVFICGFWFGYLLLIVDVVGCLRLRGVGLLLFDLFVVYFDLTLMALPVVFICLLVGVGSWFAQIVCVWFVVCVWMVACGLLLGLDGI